MKKAEMVDLRPKNNTQKYVKKQFLDLYAKDSKVIAQKGESINIFKIDKKAFNALISFLQMLFIVLILAFFIANPSYSADEWGYQNALNNHNRAVNEMDNVGKGLELLTNGKFKHSEGKAFIKRCYMQNQKHLKKVFYSELSDFEYYKAVVNVVFTRCNKDELFRKIESIGRVYAKDEMPESLVYYYFQGLTSWGYLDFANEIKRELRGQ